MAATWTVVLSAPTGTAIRHDGLCRPPGFTGTDAPDSWVSADPLAATSCNGEMHPTAGGMWPDDHDWFYIEIPAGSNPGLSVTICPIAVFVAGWNPELHLHFLPQGEKMIATPPGLGQTLQQLQPVLSKAPGLVPIGSSTNAAGCDAVPGATPPAGQSAEGGRYYIDVARAGGGGRYSFAASLA